MTDTEHNLGFCRINKQTFISVCLLANTHHLPPVVWLEHITWLDWLRSTAIKQEHTRPKHAEYSLDPGWLPSGSAGEFTAGKEKSLDAKTVDSWCDWLTVQELFWSTENRSDRRLTAQITTCAIYVFCVYLPTCLSPICVFLFASTDDVQQQACSTDQ